MTGRLDQRVIVVTGGATGIGRACAQKCLDEGARVVIAQPTLAEAALAARELDPSQDRARGFACDVRDRSLVRALFDAAGGAFGRLDGLVHSAALTGAASQPTSFLGETDAHWQRVIDVNLTGAFICAQEAAQRMLSAAHGGSIVMISSVAEFAAQELATAYCAGKAGLRGLCQVAAIELAPRGVRINNVAPGDIDTHASSAPVADYGASGLYVRRTPMGRRGQPAEIAAVVAFLLSDEASFITGATWRADGGFLSY